MRYFLATEFWDSGHSNFDLISLALVAADGRELYLQNADTRQGIWNKDLWLRLNVYPHLSQEASDWYSEFDMSLLVESFTAPEWGKPEFWGYYAAYDWVLLNRLFGYPINQPGHWPMYCRDLRQMLDGGGLQDVKRPDIVPHHALQDARWIRDTFDARFPSSSSSP